MPSPARGDRAIAKNQVREDRHYNVNGVNGRLDVLLRGWRRRHPTSSASRN